MKIVRKKLSELHKTPLNVRKHSPKQIDEYIRSLRMFGQIRPLVVTDDGEILVGNGMYEALINMGEESCDVYVVEGLSQNQRKKLMLADNKVYELGATDLFAFDEIVKSLDGDFDVPGWDDDLLRALTATREEIGQSVAEYGIADSQDESAPSGEVIHTSGGTVEVHAPYSPVVRDEQTGQIKPPQPVSEEQKPFAICPKCGEKIWL